MNFGDVLVLGVSSCIMFVFTILIFFQELQFRRNGRIIYGTIIKFKVSSEGWLYPTIEYYDDITNSTHRFKTDGNVHFKKVGDPIRIRVIANKRKRRNQLLGSLHVGSIISLVLTTLMIWWTIIFLNPYNNFSYESGWNVGNLFLALFFGLPVSSISFLLFLNQIIKGTKNE